MRLWSSHEGEGSRDGLRGFSVKRERFTHCCDYTKTHLSRLSVFGPMWDTSCSHSGEASLWGWLLGTHIPITSVFLLKSASLKRCQDVRRANVCYYRYFMFLVSEKLNSLWWRYAEENLRGVFIRWEFTFEGLKSFRRGLATVHSRLTPQQQQQQSGTAGEHCQQKRWGI